MTSLLKPVSFEKDVSSDGDFSDEEPTGAPARSKKSAPSRSHEKLIKSIASLDKKPLSQRKIERSDPAAKISDQNLSGAALKTVSLNSLLKTSGKSSDDAKVKKKLQEKKEAKILAEPLKSHEAAKVQRVVAYEEVSNELKKWDNVVASNRLAEGVSFPLDQNKLVIQTATEYVQRYQKKTELEREIEKLVGSSKNNLTRTTVLTQAEKEALEAMSIQEAQIRRQELQKHRALLSYKEKRQRWQSKIKSKNYHRHLRKSKRKIEEKEFEELKLKDPELAAEKLELLDRKRIQERATLKHRNTGKWARRMAGRAKTDKDAREALQEQLRLSRNITEKRNPTKDESNTDEEEEPELGVEDFDDVTEKILNAEAAVNPWMNGDVPWGEPGRNNSPENAKPSELSTPEVAEIQRKKIRKAAANRENEETGEPDRESEEPEVVDGGELVVSTPNIAAKKPKGISASSQDRQQIETDIDPSKLLLATKTLHKTVVPSELHDNVESDEDDDNSEQRRMIAEAFADDNVVAEFVKEKKKLEEDEKPKDIDLSLPGWGDWTGAGTKSSVTKKKRFIIKAPKGKPRKDRFLHNVIISEKHDEKLIPHQVKELPFPFTTVEQFHSSIRMPVGKTWNTETAFEEMTKPKFMRKMGAVINPIDAESALKKGKRKRDEAFADVEGRATELGKSQVSNAKRFDKVRKGDSKRRKALS